MVDGLSRSKQLDAGDRIISVNSINVERMPLWKVVAMLAGLQKIELEVESGHVVPDATLQNDQLSSPRASNSSPRVNQHLANLHAATAALSGAAPHAGSGFSSYGTGSRLQQASSTSEEQPISGFFGVSMWGMRWQARIDYLDRPNVHIGTYNTREEAAAAYDRAAREHGGTLPKCNYPSQEQADYAANAAARLLAATTSATSGGVGGGEAGGFSPNKAKKVKKRKKCPHNREKYRCKDCKGSSICPHNRVKSQCKDCGGSQICKHNKIGSRCPECGKNESKDKDLLASVAMSISRR